MGFLITIFEAVLSVWGWMKTSVAEKLGMAEQKNVDLAKQNQSLQDQLKDAVNPPDANQRLRDRKF